ncbi:type 2 DNA topoisomerase 6 subunit B-like [Austrofundulus limnaeus]|uniref:Type 2 DNA topoisomerase 6 subunit B-like n=1 Tax=Austrofundulus limnaeus TaxID=52670 RepID=A0A2I4B1Y1_AUSLI|nr:PREDICTED: uncharacterized protein C11orf80 homolog [Austrofundulus limnaeus]
MQMSSQRKQRGLKTTGGLLVFLWTDRGSFAQRLNCTVAAAGPWCAGVEMQALHPDLKNSLFPCVWSCPELDPEELSAFTDLYGPLRFLLTFQAKDAGHCMSKWQAHIEAFLRAFSLTNAGIKVHLKFTFGQQTVQHELRVKIKSKVSPTDQLPLILDVACSAQPPWCVRRRGWCQGGHPVVGERLPLSIPPQVMDQGLFGELSVQFVALLRPCVLQYPNLLTELTRIQVLTYSPSNIPVPGPFNFFKGLPAALNCQQLGLDRIHCASFKDLTHSSSVVYSVEPENWEDPDPEPSHVPVQQSLLLFLFLHHSDPFTSEVNDTIAAEMLIEHHLEEILSNNRQAVSAALEAELYNTLKAQNHRKKKQEKLQSAAEVILSSTISIVSSSSNMDFRNACLNRMKVNDTHELSASLRESLWRVTSGKFLHSGKCFSSEVEEQPKSNESTRVEI